MQQVKSNKTKALVIGNNNYPLNALKNAVNDARDIASVFKRLGYSTTVLLDATFEDQDREISKFGTEIKEADAAIFYFAGHGFQIDEQSYLAAINLDRTYETVAKRTSYPLNDLLSYMSKGGANANIVILDACRETLSFD